MPKAKKTLNHPVPFRKEVAELCSAARVTDSSTTRASFAATHNLSESTVRRWAASTSDPAKSTPTPVNAVYKKRPSKFPDVAVNAWLTAELAGRDVAVAEVQLFAEKHAPDLLRSESYKAKSNACAWMKANAQKTADGFANISPSASIVPATTTQYCTCCKRKTNCGNSCRNRRKVTECTDSICNVSFDACLNCPIQRAVSPPMEKKSCGEGEGLFALEPVSKGAFVIEYIGEIIDKEIRDTKAKVRRDAYIFQVNNKIIDSFVMGNDSRFINHSSSPNYRAECWTVGGSCYVAIFAIARIKRGEQVTYDYGPSYKISNCLCDLCKSTSA